MDHIPLPRDHIHGHPRIPCLARCLDHQPILTQYPPYTSFTTNDITGPVLKAKVLEAVLAQHWLFFGLLEAFFGDLYHQRDFVITTNTPDDPVISTRHLLNLCGQFIETTSTDSIEKLAGHIAKSHEVCARLSRGSIIDRNLLLSFQMLGSFLHKLTDRFCEARGIQSPLRNIAWQPPICSIMDEKYDILRGPDGSMDMLEKEMLDAGWCPTQINRASRLICMESKYYVSRMRPPGDFPIGRHAQCTRVQCQVDNIDLTSYKPRHTTSDCVCSEIGVDVAEMDKILCTGQQVLLDITKPFEKHGKIVLLPAKLGEDRSDVQYIAISHVWSQGLGNPRMNSLPICQLNRLRERVQLFSNTPVLPLWIDTICCPVERERKKGVLKSMRSIYKAALSVLVVDEDMAQSIVVERSICVERMLRVATSNWMGRLWTLQEGMLAGADQLVFQFDVLSNVKAFREEIKSITLGTDQMVFLQDLNMILFKVAGDEAIRARGSRLQGLQQVIEALANRSTSRATDEPLCIATLLGTSEMENVLTADAEARMLEFWRLLGTSNAIPSGILFWRYDCLGTPGFRWAPASFLGNLGQGFPIEGHDRHLALKCHFQALTDHGLQVTCPGIRLTKPGSRKMHKLFGIMIGKTQDFSHIIEKAPSVRSDPGDSSTFPLPDDLKDNLNMALVFSGDPSCASQIGPVYTTLVYIESEKEGVIFARRGPRSGVCHALHSQNAKQVMADLKYGSVIEEAPTRQDTVVRALVKDGTYMAVAGQWTDKNQIWCVD